MTSDSSDMVPAPDPGRLSEKLHTLYGNPPEGGFRVRSLFDALAGRGHAALLVVLSLPFCLPIPLLGLSVPFGLMIAFIGLRIAFRKRPWLPAWLLDKPVQPETILKMAEKCAALERRLHRMIQPRWPKVCRHPWLHFSHGITVAILAMLLALPLPIPGSNLPAAIPMLLLGLGMLEDDGLFVVFGYAAAWAGVAVFVAFFWVGGISIEHLWEWWRPPAP
jgi:hypothetical protein